MAKKHEGNDPINGCLPFVRTGSTVPRTGSAAGRDSAIGAVPPPALDALALVDLCRMLDVPTGLGVSGTAPGNAMASDDEMDRSLKLELLELNRAYARIPDGNIRRTLLQLVKAAAGPH